MLVVANRTAESPELLEALRTPHRSGPCEFTLLVPSTPHGIAWAADMHAGGDEAEASPPRVRRRSCATRGSTWPTRSVGDPDPLAAIQDECNFHELRRADRLDAAAQALEVAAHRPAAQGRGRHRAARTHVVGSEAVMEPRGARGRRARDRAPLRGMRHGSDRARRSRPRSRRAARSSAPSTRTRRSALDEDSGRRPSAALEQRHALDVRRLREHVDRPHGPAARSPRPPSGGRSGASVVGLQET